MSVLRCLEKSDSIIVDARPETHNKTKTISFLWQGDRGETGPPGPAGFAGPPVSAANALIVASHKCVSWYLPGSKRLRPVILCVTSETLYVLGCRWTAGSERRAGWRWTEGWCWSPGPSGAFWSSRPSGNISQIVLFLISDVKWLHLHS